MKLALTIAISTLAAVAVLAAPKPVAKDAAKPAATACSATSGPRRASSCSRLGPASNSITA